MTRPYLATFAHIERNATTPDKFLRMFEDALYTVDEEERYWYWVCGFDNHLPQIDFALSKLFSYKYDPFRAEEFPEILQKFNNICIEYMAKTPLEIPTDIPLVIDLSVVDGPDGDVNLTRARDPENPRHLMIETIDNLLEILNTNNENDEYFIDVLTYVYNPLVLAMEPSASR